ncbi:MAG TPA: GNAT family N-acetyltransferase [Thermoplasmata archaeon]|nr:GNAT family N-acetyltransferase [Thermoplasmata archaeon]
MIREFRRADANAVVGFLTSQFPAEEALMGSRPERFFKVIERVSRWDLRLAFALLRLGGKRMFQFLVYEDDGRLVGTTLLTFPAHSVYLSMVVIDPTVRRRGYAKALLEQARATAHRMHRRFMVLDVLADNAPARALYEGKLGYRPLRETTFMSREKPADVGPEPATLPVGIRPFRKSDNASLVAIARRHVPPDVETVLPVPKQLMGGTRTGNRIMGSESAAWVVDRGAGPEALIVATSAPDAEAGHLSDPIVSETTDPALARALLRTALAWIGARGQVRALSSVPRYNATARTALEAEGFHDALSVWTLYRPVE